ncbi:hypothetical protein CHS0354_033549, partial [Potamilus streckersoni]
METWQNRADDHTTYTMMSKAPKQINKLRNNVKRRQLSNIVFTQYEETTSGNGDKTDSWLMKSLIRTPGRPSKRTVNPGGTPPISNRSLRRLNRDTKLVIKDRRHLTNLPLQDIQQFKSTNLPNLSKAQYSFSKTYCVMMTYEEVRMAVHNSLVCDDGSKMGFHTQA